MMGGPVFTAPTADTPHWSRGTTSWGELPAFLGLADPAAEKECGGYVLGELAPTTRAHGKRKQPHEALHRNAEAVVSRWVLALDADSAEPTLIDRVRELDVATIYHTTAYHLREKDGAPATPRYRLLFLLDREVSRVGYRMLARELMDRLGIDQFDPGSDQAERFMWKPSTTDRATYEHGVLEGAPLDTTVLLAAALDREPDEPDEPEEASRPSIGAERPEVTPEYREHVRADVRLTLELMDELADLPEGGRISTWPGLDAVGWDDGYFMAAERLIQAANAGVGYELAEARKHYFTHAPEAEGTFDPQYKWRRAAERVGDTPTPWSRSSATADFGVRPDASTLKRSRKLSKYKPTQGELMAAMVLGSFVPHLTPEGQPFAVPTSGPPLAYTLGERGGAVRHQVAAEWYRREGRPASDTILSQGLGLLRSRALALKETTALHLRAHYDREANRLTMDLARRGSTECVIVEGGTWRVADAPPPGVFFQRSATTRPLPVPRRGVRGLDRLRELLGFTPDEPHWHLTRGWLTVAPLEGIPRPLLLARGPAGRGKTTRALMLINVLDPRDQLGSSFGKNIGDDQVKAARRFLVGYDNIGGVSAEVSDHICRLVTGEEQDKRTLYTDSELTTLSYRRTGVLTAVELPPLRADALERIIPIALPPLTDGDRRAELALSREFDDAHPEILADVLDGVARMVDGLPELLEANPPEPRMKDYSLALRAFDSSAHDAYVRSFSEVLADAAAEDRLVQAVVRWLEKAHADKEVVELPPNTCYREIEAACDFGGEDAGWWPRSARVMSSALTRSSNLLRELGVQFEAGKSNGVRVWRFAR